MNSPARNDVAMPTKPKKRPREHNRGRQDHLANRPVLGAGRQDGVGFDLDGRGVGMDAGGRRVCRAGNRLQRARLEFETVAWLRIDGEFQRRQSADRGRLRIESRKWWVGILTERGQWLGIGRPRRCAR